MNRSIMLSISLLALLLKHPAAYQENPHMLMFTQEQNLRRKHFLPTNWPPKPYMHSKYDKSWHKSMLCRKSSFLSRGLKKFCHIFWKYNRIIFVKGRIFSYTFGPFHSKLLQFFWCRFCSNMKFVHLLSIFAEERRAPTLPWLQ